MDYVLNLSIEPTNTIDDPAREFMEIPRGIIVEMRLDFSQNVNGTCLAQVFIEGDLTYPRSPYSAYRLWYPPIVSRDVLPLYPKENTVELRGWSQYARYPHLVQLKLSIMPMTGKIRKVPL